MFQFWWRWKSYFNGIEKSPLRVARFLARLLNWASSIKLGTLSAMCQLSSVHFQSCLSFWKLFHFEHWWFLNNVFQIEHPWINIVHKMLTQLGLLWLVKMVIVVAIIGVQLSFYFCVHLGFWWCSAWFRCCQIVLAANLC